MCCVVYMLCLMEKQEKEIVEEHILCDEMCKHPKPSYAFRRWVLKETKFKSMRLKQYPFIAGILSIDISI